MLYIAGTALCAGPLIGAAEQWNMIAKKKITSDHSSTGTQNNISFKQVKKTDFYISKPMSALLFFFYCLRILLKGNLLKDIKTCWS